MLGPYVINTTNQKVFRYLLKYSDREYYERQIARKIGISTGAANRALNTLYADNVIKRRQEGKMLFYSADATIPIAVEYKKIINLMLIEPLVEELKKVTMKIVLFGSCAQGIDTSQSDVDLFIIASKKDKVNTIISKYSFPQGFEDIRIQPTIKSPVELLKAGKAEQVFLEEVDRGIVMWQRGAG